MGGCAQDGGSGWATRAGQGSCPTGSCRLLAEEGSESLIGLAVWLTRLNVSCKGLASGKNYYIISQHWLCFFAVV